MFCSKDPQLLVWHSVIKGHVHKYLRNIYFRGKNYLFSEVKRFERKSEFILMLANDWLCSTKYIVN